MIKKKKNQLIKQGITCFMLPVIIAALVGCGLISDSSPATSQTGTGIIQSTTTGMQEDNPQDTSQDTAIDNPQGDQGKKLILNIYFPDGGNEKVIAEKREVTVIDGAILKAAVKALMEGPQDTNLNRAIPDGTTLIGVNFKDNVAILDFSKEFATADGAAEIVEKISIVNTLTDIKGVERVKILIAGKDWISPSGLPYGEMSRTASLDQ